MTLIRNEDLIQSVADALQYISYYHPPDFIAALHEAWERERSPAARDALAQILVNSRLCAEGKRPICRTRASSRFFLDIGLDVRWEGGMSVAEMVNEGDAAPTCCR